MAKNRTEANATPEPDQVSVQLYRELVKTEFYKSYDLMTGVRIAATLGGFFGIMVLFVVYKSKCKSRSLSDENLEAVAAGMSANGSGRRTLPVTDNTCWLGLAPATEVTPLEMPSTPPVQRWIEVGGSRKHSWMTSGLSWSSCETSYLDRRTSLTHSHSHNSPIDIQVIQATPEISPCASNISVYNGPYQKENLHVPMIAPLASLSSFGIGSTERDDHSVGSDSVFLDEELIDTEDEVEGFSTDSDAEKVELSSVSHMNNRESDGSSSAETRRGLRRYSSPNPRHLWEKDKNEDDEEGSSWRWRRFSGSWKQHSPSDQLPLPSNLTPNKETLF